MRKIIELTSEDITTIIANYYEVYTGEVKLNINQKDIIPAPLATVVLEEGDIY